MKYMLLNYADLSKAPNYTPEQQQAAMQSWAVFQNEMEAAGVLLHGEGLHPAANATTVRVRNGNALTTDGPFAETHEQLGGYFMIECANLDEALAWAAKDPGAKFGSVEVRPVVTYPQE